MLLCIRCAEMTRVFVLGSNTYVLMCVEVCLKLANGYPLSFDDYFVDQEDYAILD